MSKQEGWRGCHAFACQQYTARCARFFLKSGGRSRGIQRTMATIYQKGSRHQKTLLFPPRNLIRRRYAWKRRATVGRVQLREPDQRVQRTLVSRFPSQQNSPQSVFKCISDFLSISRAQQDKQKPESSTIGGIASGVPAAPVYDSQNRSKGV